MSEALYPYYERELTFIRQLARDFKKQFPAAASRLFLEENRSTDPHVERLIESFALIAGRIHHKLDDDFPELTDALLGVLYPHYLAPIPSMAMVQFDLDPARTELPGGFRIERHSLMRTAPVQGVPCRFRTGYPVTLWPVALTEAHLLPPPFPGELKPPPRTAAALRLVFECQSDLPFSALSLEKLRLCLWGENSLTTGLYELLFNHVTQVVFRPLDGDPQPPRVYKPDQCLHPVGFERDEGLLPSPNVSFPGYRLLSEFFAYPAKFLFVDLGGWKGACRPGGFHRKAEVVMYLNRTQANLEQGVGPQTFRLGCTPVVNLFEQTAEPIALTHTRNEYKIVPVVAHPNGYEVYAVEGVTSVNPSKGVTEFQPFYSFRHGSSRDVQKAFWYVSRRPATGEGVRGTDVFLNLVDLDFDPRVPAESALVVRTTCTNRDLPVKLQQAGDDLAFTLDQAAPIHRPRCLRSPSAPLRPPLRRRAYWRLISHLSLNHLSLTEGPEARQALQEILRLYDYSDPETGPQLGAVTQQLIEGITAVSSRRVVGRIKNDTEIGFCRGLEVTVEFDEQKYVDSGLFLFACVLERFLGLYVTVNSFSQLVAKVHQGEGQIKKWPQRAGDLLLT